MIAERSPKICAIGTACLWATACMALRSSLPHRNGSNFQVQPSPEPSGIGARFIERRAMKSATKRLPGACGGMKRKRVSASSSVA